MADYMVNINENVSIFLQKYLSVFFNTAKI